jgi:formate dehydrogenase major subunit
LVVIDPTEISPLAHFALKPKAGTEAEVLLGLMAAVVSQKLVKGKVAEAPTQVTPEAVSAKTGVPAETLAAAAKVIGSAQSPVFVYGDGLTAAALKNLLTLADLTKAGVLGIKGQANSLAAHAYGLDQAFDAKNCQAAYVVLGDDTLSAQLLQDLEKVPFKVVQASHISPATAIADVVLPVEMWAEQEGHYLNLEGRLQAAHRAVKPAEEVRASVAALQAVAAKLGYTLESDWKAGLQQRMLSTAILE